VRNVDGEIVRWMGTCTDINEAVEARSALMASEARLRAVIEAAPVGLLFADATGQVTGVNANVEAIIGKPVVWSNDVNSYAGDYVAFHEDGRQVESGEYPLAQVLAGTSERAQLTCRVRRVDGELTWVRYVAAPVKNANGAIAGGVVASIDVDRERRFTESLEREVAEVIGEREAAQDALRQSQKLDAMGQLTGGVAHDFNNLLTPIIGSLDLLQRKEVGDARTRRLIDGALQSAERAKTLVQRLLAFARRQPLQPTAVDVGRVVTEMTDLIGSTSGPRIQVEVEAEPDLPPAHADSNQLEMALLNLSVNARDAMPNGGTLNIGVRLATVRPPELTELRSEAGHIVLSVADTGVGMDEQTLARCIEPFFSTKGVGKGTGLGLSMVHGLAAQLGGALRIGSRKGEGTSIELWLPVSDDRLAEDRQRSAQARREDQGLVLLVDDEELVRESTASMLGELGYSVVEADSAEEALRLVGEGLRPDLLVSDHLMPGLSGTDLAVRLRQLRPGLPVLIVSGYADVDSLAPAFPRLAKPFRQADLAACLAELRGEVPISAPAGAE
jgi:PAS domain S-box-containing protein